MTDASEWGAGVVAGRRDRKLVAEAGRLCERDRFSLGEEVAFARVASGYRDLDPSVLPLPRRRVKDGPMNSFVHEHSMTVASGGPFRRC